MLINFGLLLQIYDVSIAIRVVVSLCCLNICTLCLPSDSMLKYVSDKKFLIILPPSQGIRRPRFACFSLTKIYSKYIKNVGIQLASLETIFHYESNDTNFTQYDQVLVVLFIRSNFALKSVCALFPEKEVVTYYCMVNFVDSIWVHAI